MGEPMREIWPVPESRRRLPPMFSWMSVGTKLVVSPALPMMAPEFALVPPWSVRSVPTFMTREVPADGAAPLGPPIRAVANPKEPPPVNCTEPAIWMDCTGALTTTLLSVPPAPAVSVRFTPCRLCESAEEMDAELLVPPAPAVSVRFAPCRLCEPVEEMDAELLVPSRPPRIVKLPSVPALSVWAFSVPEVLIKAELPFPPEPAVSMKPVAAIV